MGDDEYDADVRPFYEKVFMKYAHEYYKEAKALDSVDDSLSHRAAIALAARKLQAQARAVTPEPKRIPNSLKRVRRISDAEWEFLKAAKSEFVIALMRNKFAVAGSNDPDFIWMDQNFSGLYYFDVGEDVLYIETDEDTVLLKMQFEGS